MSEYLIVTQDELYHHGILGMKWGVRRYQNKDGSLTEAGKKRYAQKEEEALIYRQRSEAYNARAEELDRAFSDYKRKGNNSRLFKQLIAKLNDAELEDLEALPEETRNSIIEDYASKMESNINFGRNAAATNDAVSKMIMSDDLRSKTPGEIKTTMLNGRRAIKTMLDVSASLLTGTAVAAGIATNGVAIPASLLGMSVASMISAGSIRTDDDYVDKKSAEKFMKKHKK